ncbi:nitrilase-related carbon-nitrogen hydrolase [Chromobacterium phragmitis]|uniref:Nitrilase-related carbon-nitrogen hydrolase n=1 Tax=Chromobacterium phragmitis TaxID=2202141 RepID=A0ABV0ISK5_9NEIS
MPQESYPVDHLSSAVSVACCQLAPVFGDISGNMRRSRDILMRAADMGAQLAVLPELANTGYAFSNRDEARGLAQSDAGECVSEWRELAAQLDLIVVAGFCEGDGDGLYNSAVLLTPDGRQARYRKAHLWDGEKRIFDLGCQPPPVVETAIGRLGVMICYDLEIPEWVRLPALEGADLLCVPVNWPVLPQHREALPIEVIKAQANAAFNRLPVAVCDRAGHERGIDWAGCSLITDADGCKLALASRQEQAGADEIVFAQIDLRASRDKHISRHNHVLSDRRPDLYGKLHGTAI